MRSKQRTLRPLRVIGAVCVVALSGMLAGLAGAQGFPNRAIRFVMPYPAGSGGDTVVRTIAAKLAEMWGQQIVVDNRPGANGIIGTDIVAKAKPDGYTWVMGQTATMAVNPVLYSKLPYDATKDFEPVTQLTIYGYVLVVHPSVPVKSVKEFIALARARPGELAYSSSGLGGSQHLAGELFQLMTGVRLNHVTYKGGAPAEVAVIAGEVGALFDTEVTAIPLVQAGRLRPLGVTLRKRSISMPDIPTIAEAGVPGYVLDAWQSIMVPAGTPREIVNRIYEDTKKVLAMPDVRERLIDKGGMELIGSSPDEITRMLRSEAVKYAKLIKDTNVPKQ